MPTGLGLRLTLSCSHPRSSRYISSDIPQIGISL
jgi:hypothetical protein